MTIWLKLAGDGGPLAGPAHTAGPPSIMIPRHVPPQPAVPAAVYDDPLHRISLTSKAIRQGPQALHKHLHALEDMDLEMPVIDPVDAGDLRPDQSLSSRHKQNLLNAAKEFPRTVTIQQWLNFFAHGPARIYQQPNLKATRS
jgi:hypothetical protein